MTARRKDLLTLAAFLPVAAAILIALLRASSSDPFSAPDREIQAIVPHAYSLSPAAEVRVAGVPVGRVEKVVRRGGEAVLLLGLDGDAPPIFRDARVDIRSRTVVGESIVALTPGTPSAGELGPGDVLGPDRAQEVTQFDDVASLFDPATRQHLRGLTGSLARAVDGRTGRELNRLLAAASSSTRSGAPVLAALAERRVPLSRLVDQLGIVTRALGERRADIRTLALQGQTAVGAIHEQRAAVERLLRIAPGVLRQTQATTARLAVFSDHATAPLRDLRAAVTGLAPSLRRLAPTARRARAAVTELDRAAPRAARLMRRLRRAAPTIKTTVRPLEVVLSQVNPAVAYLRPYTREIGGFFGNLGSMVSTGDSLGRLARMSVIVSPGVLATAPKEFLQLYDRLKAIGAVSKATGTHGINPYPAPGELLHPKPFRGTYPRVEAAPIPAR